MHRIRAVALRSRERPAEQRERLDAVLQVLYLIFNEGYAATAGPTLQRTDLSSEAIRLTIPAARSSARMELVRRIHDVSTMKIPTMRARIGAR